MSEPNVRDIKTMRLSPSLASQALMVNSSRIDECDINDEKHDEIGVNIIITNIIASKLNSVIRRCLYWVASADKRKRNMIGINTVELFIELRVSLFDLQDQCFMVY